MKRTTIVIALVGVAVGVAVVVWLGAGKIAHAVFSVGWRGFAEIVGWQAAVYILLGLAWSIVCPGVSILTVVWGRLVREGGETCLPFSEIGGLLFGARAIMLRGVGLALAAASSIVDVATEGMALLPYILFGLLMLLARQPRSSLVLPLALGIALLVTGGAVAYLARRQLGRLLRWASERALRSWVKDAPHQADLLQETLEKLFGDRRRIAAAAAVHLLAWVGGGGNVWLSYHLLGARIGLLQAVAIDAMLSGALSIGFLIPGGLGVQEVSYVAFGSLFGMPPRLSLALSFIRRARDISIGAPALVAWQALEARRLGEDNRRD